MVGSGAGLVGGACGWGSGMPAPSGQIPPPWARVGERGSRHEGPLAGPPEATRIGQYSECYSSHEK
jgi:hypothetical protein